MEDLVKWMLDSDVSIQYLTYRDLLGKIKPDLKRQIASKGWSRQILSSRNDHGHWGNGFYHPKWISSHYTLLELKSMECPKTPEIVATIEKIIREEKKPDGGVGPGKTTPSDVCVAGMFLNYSCYYGIHESSLYSVVDYLLSMNMQDGGFNCNLPSIGAKHSSLHTTLSVLEGIHEYEKGGYLYRLEELKKVEHTSREFILKHHLFKSDKTGKIIKNDFLKFPFPSRWKYDILRALDYFQYANVSYDKRMEDAFSILIQKRSKDGTWKQYANYPGEVHFEMEMAGKPGRWNTLRAMRVLLKYKKISPSGLASL